MAPAATPTPMIAEGERRDALCVCVGEVDIVVVAVVDVRRSIEFFDAVAMGTFVVDEVIISTAEFDGR
tara:strand:+ start:29628 stop:29831 length:204 start_codon:yes stop_codon:yes gene_type:complete